MSDEPVVETPVVEKRRRGRPPKHGLPPAGDARRDELKRRDDALHARAETEIPQGGAIHPEALKIQHDVAAEIYDFRGHNLLNVSNALPDYVYNWIKCSTPTSPTSLVEERQVFAFVGPDGKRVPCWEVVCGTMPEAMECKDATGVRRIVDVILMRCRKDRYAAWEQHQADQRERQVSGINATALEMGARMQGRGISVHETHGDSAAAFAQARRQGMRQVAMQGLGNQIKAGTVPGLPVPGR